MAGSLHAIDVGEKKDNKAFKKSKSNRITKIQREKDLQGKNL